VTTAVAASLPLALEQAAFTTDGVPGSWKEPLVYALPDGTDRGALGAALGRVVRRHEALRTRVVERDGGWAQEIAPPSGDVAVPSWRDGLADFFDADLDLAGAGPVRAALLPGRDGPDRLLVAIHHLAFDGLSQAVFDAELWGAGEQPAPGITWSRYVAGQRSAGDRLTVAQLDYWAGVFADPLPRAPSVAPPSAGARSGFQVAAIAVADAGERLRRLARVLRVSPAAVWLAAYVLAVGASDVYLNWFHHGRDRPELARLIGCLHRVVPLRVRAAPDDSFARLCAAVFAHMRAGITHSAAPWSWPRLAAQLPAAPAAPAGVTVNVMPEGNRAVGARVAYDPVRSSSWTTRPGQMWLKLIAEPRPVVTAEYDRWTFGDDAVGARLAEAARVVATIAGRGPAAGRLTLDEIRATAVGTRAGLV
jgi:Condensation domain